MPAIGRTFCDQITTRGYPCNRVATFTAPNSAGKSETYCTQHANYYGIQRRRGWQRLVPPTAR